MILYIYVEWKILFIFMSNCSIHSIYSNLTENDNEWILTCPCLAGSWDTACWQMDVQTVEHKLKSSVFIFWTRYPKNERNFCKGQLKYKNIFYFENSFTYTLVLRRII